MLHGTRVIRSAITSLVALLLIAGVALATNAFVGGGLRPVDAKPAAQDQAAPTTNPTATPDATGKPEPTGIPDAAEPAQTPEAAEPTEAPEAAETPRPTATGRARQHEDQAEPGDDGPGGQAGSQGDDGKGGDGRGAGSQDQGGRGNGGSHDGGGDH